MTTNHYSHEPDDENQLSESLSAFEQSLRVHRPQPVTLDFAEQPQAHGWSSPTLSISPISMALSCGGSALAGAAAVLLIFVLYQDNRNGVQPAIDKVGIASNDTVAQRPIISSEILREPTGYSNAFGGNVTAGLLITHPELTQMAWTAAAITRVNLNEISNASVDSQAEPLRPEMNLEKKNTLFLLNREIQL
jgi:hypothetical protein